MDFNMHVRQIINIRAKNDLAHADAITGDQFELYMTHVLNHSGYHHVIHTPYSNDHGVDAYSKVDSISWQFKDYASNHPVSYHAVVEVLMGGLVYGTKYNVVLTNSYFPKSTWKTIRKANQNHYKSFITLIDRKRLLKLFRTYEQCKIEQSTIYQKQKKQANKKRKIGHKEYHLSSVLSGNLNRIKHQSGAIEDTFTSILVNNTDTLNQQMNSIRSNTISVLSSNLNKIKRQFSAIEDKFTSILSYRLSSLLTRTIYINHLKELLPLYLTNNTLEKNITTSESIHNFNSRVKQFAYYTLRILPKYHMTLNTLTKVINSETEILHPLSNGCFYSTLIVNITYPIAINQLHNYTKQRLIFVYYPLKYIRRICPRYPALDLHLSNNSSQSDIITIISNIKYKGVISNGITTVGYQEPIDSNSNLYKQNQFSINANTCHMFHTLINFDDISTLSNSLKLYHNPNSKHEIQSNINYLNKFYSDRKKLLPEIETMNEVREENKELREITHKLQIHNIVKNNSKKYHQLNNVIETDIDKSKAIYNFNSRTKQFAFCTLLLLFKYDVNRYIDNINRATVKKAYNWDANDSRKLGNQSNKSYYYLILNIEHDNSFQRILFIYYSPEMMRTEYKNSFPYQKLYQKALNESLYRENLIGKLTVSFSINTYIFISNLVFNPQSSGAVIKSVNHKGNDFGNINQYQLKHGNMSVAINDIKSLFQGYTVYKNRQKQIKIEKVHEAKVRAINAKRHAKEQEKIAKHEAKVRAKNARRKVQYQSQIRAKVIKNSKKYRQLNSIIEHDIDKSKAIYNFSSRTKQFAFCTLMQSVVYYPYTNNLIKAISNATVKQSTNKDDGHGENKNDFPLGLQKGKVFNYLELHADSSIYNGFYNDNLYFVYYAPNEYEYGYPYQNICGNNVIGYSHYYDDDLDDSSEFYNEYSYTIISNFVFNQQGSQLKRRNVGFQGNGQVIQYCSHYSVKSNTYVDDIKTLVQSSNVYNNYYTKFQQRMYSHNKCLINEREIPTHLTDNSIYSPLLLDKFNLHKYLADKHQEQINRKDFEDKLQHLNPRDRRLIKDVQKSRKRSQRMYEDVQHLKQGINTAGKQSIKWLRNFVNQHIQTKPYTNMSYNTMPSKSFKICPNCHAKVNKSSNFCIYCGHHFIN